MEDWQVRVYEEKAALELKLGKLRMFFRTERFRTLDHVDQELLKQQSFAMKEYADILQKRVDLFL
jgi:hypothetical protein